MKRAEQNCVTGTVVVANHSHLEVLTPDNLIHYIPFEDKRFTRFKNKYEPGDLVTLKIQVGTNSLDKKILDLYDEYENCMDPKVVNI